MGSQSNRFEGLYDLLIIGAGIVGSCAATAAARSGLRVALIERDDFGCAASANSLKVIHGGLRYLQQFNIRRMRDSIRARSLLLRLAPSLVKPRGFVLPLEKAGLKSKPAMSLALAINDFISSDRNRALAPDHRIPAGKIISGQELLQDFPFMHPSAAHGGALWYDAVAEDTERLTLGFALDAEKNGAVIANHVEAIQLKREQNRVTGITARCQFSGRTFDIRSRQVIWAGGPSLRQFDPEIADSQSAPKHWVRAVNLVLNVPWTSSLGLATETRVNQFVNASNRRPVRRNLFFVPWRGGVMAGTWYEALKYGSAPAPLLPQEIDMYLQDVQSALPDMDITRKHISMVHCGTLPATAGSNKPENSTTIHHGPRHGLPDGFTLVQAVKFTTGILVGAEAAKWAASAIGKSMRGDLWGQPIYGVEKPSSGFSAELIAHFMNREHAVTLADIIFRRSGWGTFSRPDAALLQNTAECMAQLANWDEKRKSDELNSITEFYKDLGLDS